MCLQRNKRTSGKDDAEAPVASNIGEATCPLVRVTAVRVAVALT